jgi:hypothetical protein
VLRVVGIRLRRRRLLELLIIVSGRHFIVLLR